MLEFAVLIHTTMASTDDPPSGGGPVEAIWSLVYRAAPNT
jgi:hypothetical protein